MKKTTLTFPAPADGGGFLFEIDGDRYEIQKFTDIIGSLGVDRRAAQQNVDRKDFGTRVRIALELAVKDDGDAVVALDHLDTQQGIELLTKWAEFTGADLPE